MAATNFHLRIYSSLEELEGIAAEWEALAAAQGRPLDTPVWHDCAYRCVHSAGEILHIMTLWCADQLVGIVPLVLTSTTGRPRFEIIGSRALYEPANILAASPEAAAQLVEALASLEHPLLLTRIAQGGVFTELFRRRARASGFVMQPSASGTPYIDLDQGWESYYASLPSRLKNVIRRGERQLKKSASVTCQFIRPGIDEIDALMDRAFRIESRGWKGRAGSAVLSRPDLRNFFFAYGRRLAARHELLVAFLLVDGEAVAMQFANISGNAYWQLKIGYDEQYAKQLVGLQLQMAVIRWSFEQGLQRYEFLGTAQPWIHEWTPMVRPYRTFLFYPRNLAGMRALLADSVARLRGRLFQSRAHATTSKPSQARSTNSDTMRRLANDG